MEITPEELKAKLERTEKITLIDVREPEEQAVCHIKGTHFIPMGELEDRLGEFDPDELMILYCHHGIRSAQAALWFREKGFRNAKSLEGGIDAWAERIDPSMGRY